MTEKRTSGGTAHSRFNPRELALTLLLEILEKGNYCHTVLNEAFSAGTELGKQDRAFITRLCRGTVERCITLDFEIEKYSSLKVTKMKPFIRNLLRMSAYQLGYMSQTPSFSICNEAVKLVKKRHMTGLTGFVNGILRKMSEHRAEFGTLPEGLALPRELSLGYSVPEWLVLDWLERFGERTVVQMLQSFLEDSPLSIRINESRASISQVREWLLETGVAVAPGRLFPEAVSLKGVDTVSGLRGYREGAFVVQDESSMCVVKIAGIQAGDRILDVCAAPGGKALHAAELLCLTETKAASRKAGGVIARDISEIKANRIRENLARCGYSNVAVQVRDASVFYPEDENSADIVLADLPCSGLGILGRKPDIRYRVTPELKQKLAELQRLILSVVFRYVKPGGILVYSTCTISEEENEQNYSYLISELGLEPESLDPWLPEVLRSETTRQGYLQFLPGIHGTDGFFIAKFRKGKTENTDRKDL